jgi:hypothetical protein
VSAPYLLVKERVYSLRLKLGKEFFASLQPAFTGTQDDQMVLDCDGLVAVDYSRHRSIFIAMAGCPSNQHKRRFKRSSVETPALLKAI